MDLPVKFLDFIDPHRYKVAYGGRGSAKSWTVARLLIEFARRTRIRVLCARELQTSIKDSVIQLLADTIERCGYKNQFRVLKTEIECIDTGSRFLFYGIKNNITKIKSLEAIDICWVEEAENVSENSWEVLIPTIRKEGSEIWVTFNPKNILDSTYQRFVINPPNDCISILVNYTDNPYFPDTLRREMEECRERDYELYRHVWLGEPVADSDLSIIKPSWIEAAIDAHLKLNFEAAGERVVGFDVADEGEDDSALVFAHGSVVQRLDSWHEGDILDSSERAYKRANEWAADKLTYDSIGMGAGVKANLSRIATNKALEIIGFNAGDAVVTPYAEFAEGKSNKDMFCNLKAQTWWNVRQRFFNTWRAVNGKQAYPADELISLSSDLDKLQELCAELSRPRIDYDQNGRAKVESKRDMKKRGIPSPNLADALVMCFVPRDNSAFGFFI